MLVYFLLQSYGISGIEIKKVTKIEDRDQYYRFSDTVKKAFECNNPQTKRLKELFEYLFIVGSRNETADPLDFQHSGCGLGEPIVFSNSIGLVENNRLKQTQPGAQSVTGELVLCKVYIADMKEHHTVWVLHVYTCTCTQCTCMDYNNNYMYMYCTCTCTFSVYYTCICSFQ